MRYVHNETNYIAFTNNEQQRKCRDFDFYPKTITQDNRQE